MHIVDIGILGTIFHQRRRWRPPGALGQLACAADKPGESH
jgi:hypothetical protein